MSAQRSIRISEDLYQQLSAEHRNGESYTKTISRLLDRPPTAPPLNPSTQTIRDAAMTILEHLRPGSRDVVLDLCKMSGRPPEDYVLSWCQLVEDQGNLSYVLGERQLEHDRDQSKALTEPPAAVPGHKVCEFCGSAYKPHSTDQRFCPDPKDGTPSCGRKAYLRQIHTAAPRVPDPSLQAEDQAFMRTLTGPKIALRDGSAPLPEVVAAE